MVIDLDIKRYIYLSLNEINAYGLKGKRLICTYYSYKYMLIDTNLNDWYLTFHETSKQSKLIETAALASFLS